MLNYSLTMLSILSPVHPNHIYSAEYLPGVPEVTSSTNSYDRTAFILAAQ